MVAYGYIIMRKGWISMGMFELNLLLLKLKTENWKHCNKIIFKCVNSAVRPIFNIFKCVNSSATVREQWFLSLYNKFMWFYCLCAKKKKKKPKTLNSNGYIKKKKRKEENFNWSVREFAYISYAWLWLVSEDLRLQIVTAIN